MALSRELGELDLKSSFAALVNAVKLLNSEEEKSI
jgi:hypothetical protein